MNRLFKILTLLFVIFCGCDKEDVEPKASMTVPILTGFEFRDELGDRYTIVGAPNIKLNDSQENSGLVNYSLISYPNPNISMSYYGVYFNNRISFSYYSSKPVTYFHFWIERGNYSDDLKNLSTYLGASYFTPNERLVDLYQYNLNSGNARIVVDPAKIPPGYYRAFLEINDVLLWDNLMINTRN